jgi:hypothetical protein
LTIRLWQGRPFNACPVEHDQIGWFELGELPKLDLAHPAYVDLLGALLTCESSESTRKPVGSRLPAR